MNYTLGRFRGVVCPVRHNHNFALKNQSGPHTLKGMKLYLVVLLLKYYGKVTKAIVSWSDILFP